MTANVCGLRENRLFLIEARMACLDRLPSIPAQHPQRHIAHELDVALAHLRGYVLDSEEELACVAAKEKVIARPNHRVVKGQRIESPENPEGHTFLEDLRLRFNQGSDKERS